MTWMNADFRAYPARIKKFHIEAAYFAPNPTIIGAFPSRAAAKSEAIRYIRFRYLVNKNPGVERSLDELLARYHFRTKIIPEAFGIYRLELLAREVLTSEFLAAHIS